MEEVQYGLFRKHRRQGNVDGRGAWPGMHGLQGLHGSRDIVRQDKRWK